MIFVMGAKQWFKDSKKLIEEKDYLILDCTDGQESKMIHYSNTMGMDDFCIPSKLLHAMSSEIGDEYIDISSAEELEKEFFRSSKFATSVLATISAYLDTEREINIFIILRNRAYRYYRKRFVSEFCRVFPEAESLVVIYTDDKNKMKKSLRKELSENEKEFLKKELLKKEKEMETNMKSKEKKKKKKKSKGSKGWGFSKKDFKLK